MIGMDRRLSAARKLNRLYAKSFAIVQNLDALFRGNEPLRISIAINGKQFSRRPIADSVGAEITVLIAQICNNELHLNGNNWNAFS